MDIQKFQQKLTEVCELGEKNGKVLKPEQIKECFGELDLDKSQLIKILQYLKLKGISIEGAEEISAASQTGPEEVSEEKEEKVPLTAEEEAYLKEYLEGLEEQEQGERSAEELFELISKGDALAQAELSQKYLHAAAEMAVEMNCEEIFIADLIQEANISLLMALGEEEPEEKDEKWLLGRIRCGIRHAIEEQTQRKFEDDYLVAKVEKLEAAVRELTELNEISGMDDNAKPVAVIFNLGVNDLIHKNRESISYDSVASDYASYMNGLSRKLTARNCELFYMSVNPCNTAMKSTRKESEIRGFNNRLRQRLNGNFTWINSYSYLMRCGYTTRCEFRGYTDDGVHYSMRTYKRIYAYAIKQIR